MNTSETAQIVMIVKAVYPLQFQKYSEQDYKNMVTAWSAVFEPYPFEIVNAGLQIYLTSDTKGFPPAPGQVIDKIMKIQHPVSEDLTENEAWSLVQKAISNSSYNSREEFEKLPKLVQKAVGSPENLHNCARMNLEQMEIEKSHFERNYRTVLERRNEEAKIPEKVKLLIRQGSDVKRLAGDVRHLRLVKNGEKETNIEEMS